MLSCVSLLLAAGEGSPMPVRLPMKLGAMLCSPAAHL